MKPVSLRRPMGRSDQAGASAAVHFQRAPTVAPAIDDPRRPRSDSAPALAGRPAITLGLAAIVAPAVADRRAITRTRPQWGAAGAS